MVKVFDSSMYYLMDVTMMLLAKVFRKVSNLGDKLANMSHRSSDLMMARCVVLVCQTSKEDITLIGRLFRFLATARVETANVEKVFIIQQDDAS